MGFLLIRVLQGCWVFRLWGLVGFYVCGGGGDCMFVVGGGLCGCGGGGGVVGVEVGVWWLWGCGGGVGVGGVGRGVVVYFWVRG